MENERIAGATRLTFLKQWRKSTETDGMRSLFTVVGVLSFFFFSLASFGETFATHVQSVLPKPIQSLKLGKTTLKDARAILGQENWADKGRYYWAFDGLKYSLALSFDKNGLGLIQFRYVKNKPTLDSFKPYFSDPQMKTNYQSHPSKKSRPTKGLIIFSEGGAIAEFSPVTKTLDLVELKE